MPAKDAIALTPNPPFQYKNVGYEGSIPPWIQALIDKREIWFEADIVPGSYYSWSQSYEAVMVIKGHPQRVRFGDYILDVDGKPVPQSGCGE